MEKKNANFRFYSNLPIKVLKKQKQKKVYMKKKTNLTIKIYDNHTKNNNNNLNSPLSIKTCSSTPFASQFIKQNNKYIDLTNKKIIYDKDYKCNLSNYISVFE